MIVYVLDDEPLELATWEIAINRLFPDWKCKTFFTFDTLLTAINEEAPDCCVVDLIMPYHPGTEVCHDVREKYPNIKVFINTYECGEEYKILAHACDATYMSKTTPFDERLEVILNACKS